MKHTTSATATGFETFRKTTRSLRRPRTEAAGLFPFLQQ